MNDKISPEASAVEPLLVASRVSVVLVEKAKAGGAHQMQYPRVDRNLQLLAGLAKPASVTVCEDGHILPSVEKRLSSPNRTGNLFPAVPTGSPFPVGQVGPIGSSEMTSLSDMTMAGSVDPITDFAGPMGQSVTVTRGPVGSYGMLSPCDSTYGPVGPSVARGPVGSYGMLSPCDSTPGPVGPPVARGPVGSYGMLSPCDSTHGPVGSYGTLSPCDSDSLLWW